MEDLYGNSNNNNDTSYTIGNTIKIQIQQQIIVIVGGCTTKLSFFQVEKNSKKPRDNLLQYR